MKLYVYFFLLGYLQCNAAHDVEIQAAMNLMPNFLNGLRSGAAYVTKLIRMKMQADAEKQLQASQSQDQNQDQSQQPNTKPNDLSFKAEDEVAENKVIQELSDRANNYLKSFARKMQKQIGAQKDYTPILNKCLKDFNRNLDAYNAYLQGLPEPEDKFENDMILTDMVDTVNILTRTQQKRLFTEYIESVMKKDKAVIPNAPRIASNMAKDILNLKKQDLNYLCKQEHVCKIFPAFSDRLAELSSEFIKLSEHRYKTFIITILKLLKKQEIFPIIMDKQMYNDMSEFFDKLKDNDEKSREWITLIRSIIIQRHKSIFGDIDRDYKLRTEAIRILLDIIDKVYYLDNTSDLAQMFESVTNALKGWSNGNRNDLEMILNTFLSYCDRKLKIAWDVFDIKDEVKTLIDVMKNGETENNKVILNRLLKVGTVFTKNESLENDTTDVQSEGYTDNNVNLEEPGISSKTTDY